MIHNPLSNLRLGSGISPIILAKQNGVNVTFGCDGAASNDSQNLLEVLKIASMLQNITTHEYRQWLSPYDVIKMATTGGAKALNLEHKVGEIKVGTIADLVLYDITQLSMLPRTDPIGALIYGTHTKVIQYVWINGEKVLNDYSLVIDEENIRKKIYDRSDWLINENSKSGILHNSVVEKYDRALLIGSETGKPAYPALTSSCNGLYDQIKTLNISSSGKLDQAC